MYAKISCCNNIQISNISNLTRITYAKDILQIPQCVWMIFHFYFTYFLNIFVKTLIWKDSPSIPPSQVRILSMEINIFTWILHWRRFNFTFLFQSFKHLLFNLNEREISSRKRWLIYACLNFWKLNFYFTVGNRIY